MTPATDKQINYLISLANRKAGTSWSYLSQVRGTLGLSASKCSRGLTKAEASALIDSLLTETAR